MTKPGGILLFAAVIVALTGCSASPAEPLTAETSAPVSASASPSDTSKAMSLKRSAEHPESKPDFMGGLSPDEYFLASMSGMWVGSAAHPNDAELLDLGRDACAQLSSGTSRLEIVVVDGMDPDSKTNNGNVVTAGTGAFCYDDL